MTLTSLLKRTLATSAQALVVTLLLLAATFLPTSAETPVNNTAPKESSEAATKLNLSESEATAVGNKVWRNECGGRIDGLTSWNVGEAFPSLGIGHFIWYPEGATDPFEESFPRLVAFLKEHGARLPVWLSADMHCPWKSRELFLAEIHGKELTELRAMLAGTVALQTKFIVSRLEAALPKMLDTLPPAGAEKIRGRFYKLIGSGSAGTFALIDYVNFKGEGVNEKERYHGQGWGLLQVLQGMSDSGNVVQAFSNSAAKMLALRVQNSPPERHEERWLPGWKKRVTNYVIQ